MKYILLLLFLTNFAFGTETGYASWYGKENKISSTGKVLQHTKYPAVAHKTLPIGTRVKIEHLKNKKVITAVVEDRGPYKKCRIIDLNFAAAKELNIIEEGIALVRVTKVL